MAFELPAQDGVTNIESVTMHRFQKGMSTMVSKENLFNFHMRYLNAAEREIAKKALYVEAPK